VLLVENFGANAYLGIQIDVLHVVLIFAGLMRLLDHHVPRLHICVTGSLDLIPWYPENYPDFQFHHESHKIKPMCGFLS
jgi:hypothetical protein